MLIKIIRQVSLLNSKHINFVIPFKINARIAHRIVYFVQKLKSNIYFEMANRCINAESLVGVLSLGLKPDDNIIIHCYNKNEQIVEEDCEKVETFLNGIASDEM